MSSASINHRPLLRLQNCGDVSGAQLEDFHYGGAVWEVNSASISNLQAAQTLAAQCRDNDLEFWIDISRFPNWSGAASPYQFLEFAHLEAQIQLNPAHLDPFGARSTESIIAWLGDFDTKLLTGVLDELSWRDLSGEATPLPPFPWTPNLTAQFDSERLIALVSSAGDEAARTRQEYWDSAWKLLNQNRFERLENWCAANLAYAFRALRPEWEALQIDGVLRARLNCAFVNSQTFPARLPSQSPGAMLRQAYRLLHAGARRFQIEYSAHSFSPAGKIFNNALTRAVARLQDLEKVVRLGVLFPARSCQTHYHPQGHRFTRWVGEDLKRAAKLLDDLHFDWVFITEEEIALGTLQHNSFTIPARDAELEMLAVPGATALATHTWRKLEAFTESGGKVACLGLLPRWSERGRDTAFENAVGKAALVVTDDLYQAYAAHEEDTPLPPTIGFPVFREQTGGGRLCSYQPHLNPDVDDARLRVHQILRESIKPDFESQSSDIRYAYFQSLKADMFFVLNDADMTQQINMRLQAHSLAERFAEIVSFDPSTESEINHFAWMRHPAEQGGGISLSLSLAPGEARIVTIASASSRINAQIESATFEVQSFDETSVRGYAIETGRQKLALRKDEKLHWYQGPFIELPSPILLDDWQAIDARTFLHEIFVPDEWRDCEIFLEVAGIESFCEIAINNHQPVSRIAAPWRFSIASTLQLQKVNTITLRTDIAYDESTLLGRLVAYPQIEVSLKESDNE